MKITTHAKITRKELGYDAVDIHEWIDAFFDRPRFEEFKRTGVLGDYNPYDHRERRHCKEVVEECVEAFQEKYPENVVRQVFELHVRGDYDGYYPSKKDFENRCFHLKYHQK